MNHHIIMIIFQKNPQKHQQNLHVYKKEAYIHHKNVYLESVRFIIDRQTFYFSKSIQNQHPLGFEGLMTDRQTDKQYHLFDHINKK